MTLDLRELKIRRDKLRSEMAEVDTAIDKALKLPTEQRRAEWLHRVCCKHNHVDACGFYDEDWANMPVNGSKARWVENANKVFHLLRTHCSDQSENIQMAFIEELVACL